jgi:hypothetical protein
VTSTGWASARAVPLLDPPAPGPGTQRALSRGRSGAAPQPGSSGPDQRIAAQPPNSLPGGGGFGGSLRSPRWLPWWQFRAGPNQEERSSPPSSTAPPPSYLPPSFSSSSSGSYPASSPLPLISRAPSLTISYSWCLPVPPSAGPGPTQRGQIRKREGCPRGGASRLSG